MRVFSLIKFTKSFICFDALPKMAHYTKDQDGYDSCKDDTSFILAIISDLKRYFEFVKYKRTFNHIYIIADDINIEYIINTSVADVLASSLYLSSIKECKYFIMEGFEAVDYGFKKSELMPKLEYEIVSDNKEKASYLICDRRYWQNTKLKPVKPRKLTKKLSVL